MFADQDDAFSSDLESFTDLKAKLDGTALEKFQQDVSIFAGLDKCFARPARVVSMREERQACCLAEIVVLLWS
jgi:hypothetical protein